MIFICSTPTSGSRLIRNMLVEDGVRTITTHSKLQLEAMLVKYAHARPHRAIVPLRDPATWVCSTVVKGTLTLPGLDVHFTNLNADNVVSYLRQGWGISRAQLAVLAEQDIPTLVIKYEDIVKVPKRALKAILEHAEVRGGRFAWRVEDGDAKWREMLTHFHHQFDDLATADAALFERLKEAHPEWEVKEFSLEEALVGAPPPVKKKKVVRKAVKKKTKRTKKT